jgi:hypothetical protein
VEADRGPSSPKRIEAVYAKGREYPLGKTAKTHEHQKNQFAEDRHDNAKGRYDNDTSGWVRGEGSINGGLYPLFDHGKLDPNSVPPKARGPRNTASGENAESSPLSAANKTWGSKPTLNKDDWG